MIATMDNMAGKREMTAKMVGSVLVVGGGIAGMQAALDCANAGFKVCLLEEQPCIGGNMAMLDKTFPTNDCAMCMISPRLVDVGRHPSIELITYADLMEVSGEAGNFKVRVRKRSRYVDPDKCNGCGECVEACSVEMQNEFDLELGKRKAIYRLYPQAVPNTFTIQKKGIPPCQHSCPTGVNIQGYVALIGQKKYAEALALYKEKNPFPGICGRICHHPCEDECNRGKELDEPIASQYLHRFLADLEMAGLISTDATVGQKNTSADKPKGKKVAIIGSGPAGLTVAYDLAQMGYQPTVFEALPVTGGMLRVGIPSYRLPEEVLDYEIEAIRKAGVKIKTSTPIGPDLTLNDLFEKGYEAIFIAIGTHKSRRLNIEGEDLQGVIHGVGFLQGVQIGKKESLAGKVVAVVGGGNVALDSVRTALRLGAKKALVVYRRSKSEIPAFESELEEAEQEGIEIHYLASPKRILGKKGKVAGMECVRMELGEPDETGRRRPIPIDGSEFTLEVDVVIPAVSQLADLSLLDNVSGLKVTQTGVLPVDGVDLGGVYGFTDFLREASLGHSMKIGPRTIVIGGGNVAIDVARTAVRLGCKEIHLACLEKRDEMPALKSEVEGAELEGVIIHNSRAPVRIVGKDDRATGVKFVECTSVFDNAGNFNPKFKEGTESVIESETIIVAIGQMADYTLLKAADGILVTKAEGIQVDDISYATNMRGVFAGGDVIGGTALVLNAIAQGHEAAISIDRFIRGEDLKSGRVKREPVEISETPKEPIEPRPREVMRTLSVKERIRSFDEVELGFTEEQALAEAKRCLNCGGCCSCLECVRICKADAVDHEMKDQFTDLNVGAIVMANGYETFDPSLKSEYGFGRFPNVVTSLQFERILSASGPYQGHLKRPSDGRTPIKIAWIQCVGSRDVTLGNDYCSSVCCMYAVKEAIIAKEHESSVEPTIFFTDIRAFGKGFEEFYNRAKEISGVRFVRSQVSDLKENPESRNPIVRYVAEKNGDQLIVQEEFDMVVLSVGLVAHSSAASLTRTAGVENNRFGFARSEPFELSRSNRQGIFLSGAANGPKDIPETVMQSSAAAALCGELLNSVRGTEVTTKEFPPEKDVTGAEPKIGVFVCHCGINIASVVDVEAVIDYVRTLGGVVHAQNTLYTCSQDTQELIKEIIKEKDLNRVIVASCTPRTHEPLFRQTLREAGLNEYMFEMVNIREQCSWVHQQQKDAATAKAESLIRGAVGKAHLLQPVRLSRVSVTNAAVVVGGGISGMTVALSLARQGFRAHLVEKESKLGGNLPHIRHSLEGYDWQAYLDHAIREVTSHQNIEVYVNSEIDEVSGFIGNFRTKLTGSTDEIEHGVMVVATGGDAWRPDNFMYGEDERILTQWELEDQLESGFSAKSVVMIQCVGSRCDDREYCSRVCCGEAVKNAIAAKEHRPDTDVYILYRDIRTYEFREEYYRKARENGVKFIRFPDDEYPTIANNGDKLVVNVHDDVIGEKIPLDADLVVLSVATIPRNEENERLAKLLKVPLDKDGFFMEAHVKLRPVEFANAGIFVCGLAHSPKYTEENISQALAVAGRAACVLSQDFLEVGGAVACVDPDKCASCLTCMRECAYDAPFINAEGKAEIEAAKCQGCGNCAAACPAKAIQLSTFTDDQEEALFKSILQEGSIAELELVADKVT